MTRFLIIFIFILVWPFTVFADGIFVWQNEDIDIHEPEQKALLIFEDGIEELVLEVKFEGAPEEFGWIVPLPSRPEMKDSTPEVFEVLSKITQNPYFGKSDHALLRSFAGVVVSELSVEHQRVGIYDVVLIDGGNQNSLWDWLQENDFRLRGNAKQILGEYQDAGWVFAAMKIAPEEINGKTKTRLSQGKIQPIYFRFATDTPVFPLKISSINGHASEVLLYSLAAGGLVPGPHPTIQWETTCRAGALGRIFQGDWFLDGLYERFSERKEIVLTKSRAVFEPSQMQDIFLEAYSPTVAITSGDLRQRAEAMTYLGYLAPSGAVAILLEYLAEATLPVNIHDYNRMRTQNHDGISQGQDTCSALWALGEIISKGKSSPQEISQSMAMLEKWINKGNTWATLEAMSSLIKISEEDALPVCLDFFVNNAEIDWRLDYKSEAVGMCTDLLLARGNKDCLAGLQVIIDEHYEPGSWDVGWLHHQHNRLKMQAGRMALQIAAACGDSVAQEEITDILLQAAPFCSWRNNVIDGKLSSRGSINNIPDAIVPAQAIVFGSLKNGEIVSQLVRNYEEQPQLRDALFRDIVHRSWDGFDIPGDYRAVLLSHVEELQNEDVALLLDIWDRSVRGNDRIKVFMSKGGNSQKEDFNFNLDALAVSYALGAQGAVETLRGLWDKTPWTSIPEKSHLAMGLALTDSVDAVGPVVEYVTNFWGEAALQPELLVAVESFIKKSSGWPYSLHLDLTFREHCVSTFLIKRASMELQVLAKDPNQPPLLRLYYLLKMSRVWVDAYDVKFAALKELRPEFTAPGILSRIDRLLDELKYFVDS